MVCKKHLENTGLGLKCKPRNGEKQISTNSLNRQRKPFFGSPTTSFSERGVNKSRDALRGPKRGVGPRGASLKKPLKVPL